MPRSLQQEIGPLTALDTRALGDAVHGFVVLHPSEASSALFSLAREWMRRGEFVRADHALAQLPATLTSHRVAAAQLLRARILLHAGNPRAARRVLAAVDSSHATRCTLVAADIDIHEGNFASARRRLLSPNESAKGARSLPATHALLLATSYLLEDRYTLALGWVRRARRAIRRSRPVTSGRGGTESVALDLIEAVAALGLDRVDLVRAIAREAAARPRTLSDVVTPFLDAALACHGGDFDRCVSLADQLLPALERRGDRIAASIVARCACRAAVRLGLYRRAEGYLRPLRELATAGGCRSLVTIVETETARLCDARGDAERARHHLTLALSHAPRAAFVRVDAALAGVPGAIRPSVIAGAPHVLPAYIALRDAEQGLRCGASMPRSHVVDAAATAHQWYASVGAEHEASRALLALGEARARSGDVVRAAAALTRAADIAEAFHYRPLLIATELVRAHLADRSGDLPAYVRAMAKARRLASPHLVDAALASACLRVGLDAAANPREAAGPWTDLVGRLGLDRPGLRLVSLRRSLFLTDEGEPIDEVLDLQVDVITGKVTAAEQVVDLSARRQLIRLLEVLTDAGEAGISLEHLYLEVWQGREYHPLKHRTTVHVALTRLRAALGPLVADLSLIEQHEGGYRIAPSCAVALRRSALRSSTSDGAQAAWQHALDELEQGDTNLVRLRTSFVGRGDSLAALERLLAGSRLVSIVGPPGTGKSALARRYCEGQLDLRGARLPGGVWFVDLSAASDGDDICRTLADTLDAFVDGGDRAASVSEQVGLSLGSRGEMLVVLDNVEHVVEETAAMVTRWLDVAPDLRLLLTTRETLGVLDESRFELGALELPGLDESDAEVIAATEAVRLFLDRATGYEYRAEDAPTLARLVRRLDGLPLALELAAVRAEILTPAEILGRLGERLDLLARSVRGATERERTLRGAIDWSWRLLSSEEQAVLAACSVFRGGFTLEAVAWVYDADGDEGSLAILDVVQSLRNKSLVRAHSCGHAPAESRLDLLETIRSFAAQKLGESGLWSQRARRHALFFARLADPDLQTVSGGTQIDARLRRFIEQDNLTAAFDRTESRDPDAAVFARLALALANIHATRGSRGTQLLVLDRAAAAAAGGVGAALAAEVLIERARANKNAGNLERAVSDLSAAAAHAEEADDMRLHARVWGELGHVREFEGAPRAAEALYERSLATLEDHVDLRAEERVRTYLGRVFLDRGDVENALRQYERARDIAEDLGDRRLEGKAFLHIGNVRARQRHYDDAICGNRHALAAMEEVGFSWGAAVAIGNIGRIEQERGELDAAQRCMEQALAVTRRTGNRRSEALTLTSLGEVLHERGQLDAAQELYSRALTLFRDIGDRRFAARVRAKMGAALAQRGDVESAHEHLDGAEDTLRELGDDPGLHASRIHRAHLLVSEAEVAMEAGERHTALALAQRVGVLLDEAEHEDTPGTPGVHEDVRIARRIVRSHLGSVPLGS